MILFDFNENDCESRGLKEIFSDIDAVLSSDWRNKIEEICMFVGQLGRNDDLLRTFILANCSNLRFPALTGAQSFPILKTDSMLVRINMWLTRNSDPSHSDSFRRYLSINELHNHNFDLFTTCLYGSGYTSTFYRDPCCCADRKVGDTVALETVGKFALPKGRAMFIEAEVDYHTQHWPNSYSVTVNVIPEGFEKARKPQFLLDGQFRIKSRIGFPRAPNSG